MVNPVPTTPGARADSDIIQMRADRVLRQAKQQLGLPVGPTEGIVDMQDVAGPFSYVQSRQMQ